MASQTDLSNRVVNTGIDRDEAEERPPPRHRVPERHIVGVVWIAASKLEVEVAGERCNRDQGSSA
jgi:hypothetical protein